jgi:hypothetical protein
MGRIIRFGILGENGTFRIRRGKGECGFESSVVAGLAKIYN